MQRNNDREIKWIEGIFFETVALQGFASEPVLESPNYPV